MHLEEAAFAADAKWLLMMYGLVCINTATSIIMHELLCLGGFVTSFHVHMTKS
jgi:hypothetical protein